MKVIRILEDPAVPKGVANQVFRQAAKDSASVLVVAWSPYRWRDAAKDWEARTRKTHTNFRIFETDEARWLPDVRYRFPGDLSAWLNAHPVELLVVADDFVVLPAGMPGGHIFAGHSGYCPICNLWHLDSGPGC